jgi:hypothetical protein
VRACVRARLRLRLACVRVPVIVRVRACVCLCVRACVLRLGFQGFLRVCVRCWALRFGRLTRQGGVVHARDDRERRVVERRAAWVDGVRYPTERARRRHRGTQPALAHAQPRTRVRARAHTHTQPRTHAQPRTHTRARTHSSAVAVTAAASAKVRRHRQLHREALPTNCTRGFACVRTAYRASPCEVRAFTRGCASERRRC